MIFGLMTVGALHVELTTHMDVIIFGGEVQTLVEVAVLDAVPAAAVEVTFATILARRRTDRTCRGKQIYAVGRITEQAFAVRAGVGMAGETIYVFRVGLFRFFTGFPAIPGMTGHAFVFIALGADAEVIDLVDLSDRHWGIAPGNIESLRFPCPVCGAHHLSRGIWMTFQAGARDFLSRFQFAFDDIRVVHMHRLLGQVVCRICGGLIGVGEEVKDRDENHDHDSEQSQGPKGEALLHTFSLTEFVDEVGSLSQPVPHCGTQKIHRLNHALIHQVVGDDRSLTFGEHKSAFAQNLQMSRCSGLGDPQFVRKLGYVL